MIVAKQRRYLGVGIVLRFNATPRVRCLVLATHGALAPWMRLAGRHV
jgi:hypothetical protein